eukprot:TRINITY_DN67483_c0_g1_i1.p1 TRINITY_DN67483_c0_g1~~TRINITY_DN67483_c0_g1_i1.p1  ORF type:complete len:418 (+),score=51.41 TRINITY_DN67483_c0_g1_i1:42-1295(+)
MMGRMPQPLRLPVPSLDTGNPDDLGSCGGVSSLEIRSARLRTFPRDSPISPRKRSSAARSVMGGVGSSGSLALSASTAFPCEDGRQPLEAPARSPRNVPTSDSVSKASAWVWPFKDPSASSSAYGVSKATSTSKRGSEACAISSNPPSPRRSDNHWGATTARVERDWRGQKESSTSGLPAFSPQVSAQSLVCTDELTHQRGIARSEEAANTGVRAPVVVESEIGTLFSWASVAGKQEQSSRHQLPIPGLARAVEDGKRQLEAISCEPDKNFDLRHSVHASSPVASRKKAKDMSWKFPCGMIAPLSASFPASWRELDEENNNTLKSIGLFESMPFRNPVVTRVTDMGAALNITFGDSELTPRRGAWLVHERRSHSADDLKRHSDKHSREQVGDLGHQRGSLRRNPVVDMEPASCFSFS